jgi:hypothetical protein
MNTTFSFKRVQQLLVKQTKHQQKVRRQLMQQNKKQIRNLHNFLKKFVILEQSLLRYSILNPTSP